MSKREHENEGQRLGGVRYHEGKPDVQALMFLGQRGAWSTAAGCSGRGRFEFGSKQRLWGLLRRKDGEKGMRGSRTGSGAAQNRARHGGGRNRGSGAARAVALSEESGEGAVGEVGDEADVQAPRVRGRREERMGQPDGPRPKRGKGKAQGGLGQQAEKEGN